MHYDVQIQRSDNQDGWRGRRGCCQPAGWEVGWARRSRQVVVAAVAAAAASDATASAATLHHRSVRSPMAYPGPTTSSSTAARAHTKAARRLDAIAPSAALPNTCEQSGYAATDAKAAVCARCSARIFTRVHWLNWAQPESPLITCTANADLSLSAPGHGVSGSAEARPACALPCSLQPVLHTPVLNAEIK